MIKFRAKDNGDRDLLGLGLSRKNCERLLKGEPIVVDLTEVMYEPGTGPHRVLIFAGETEDTMTLQLIEMGVMSADDTNWHGGSDVATDD